VCYMMEKGKLCFSLQKYYKTLSDKAKGKENSILYFPSSTSQSFIVDTLNPIIQVRLRINLVMSWFEVMFKIIYTFSSRTSKR